MEQLVNELREILEVEVLQLESRFDEMAEWDSLNALSIIALLDTKYKLSMDTETLNSFPSIKDFIHHVLA